MKLLGCGTGEQTPCREWNVHPLMLAAHACTHLSYPGRAVDTGQELASFAPILTIRRLRTPTHFAVLGTRRTRSDQLLTSGAWKLMPWEASYREFSAAADIAFPPTPPLDRRCGTAHGFTRI